MTGTLQTGVFLDLETVDNGDLDREAVSRSLPHWEWHEFSTAEQVTGRIGQADVVISNKCVVDRPAIEAATRLKLIALAATGTNNVDLDAASDHGVTVCNIRDYASDAVAQHAITLMLNLLTAQPWYWQSVRRGDWSNSRQFCLNDRPIRQAAGMNLGIVGGGVLGRATAKLAEGLGMNVLLAERKNRPTRSGRIAFEQVVKEADVLSIHCPLSEETRGLVDRDLMMAMKKDALLINTARGAIVNETDLADCLREGIIAGAGIDVLSQEPPPADHPLLAPDIPNLLVTPHNAWASRSARQAALDQLAAIIKAFAAGNPLNQVN